MYRGAIGLIETRGSLGAVEAADAMSKCAAVELLGQQDIGGGYCCVAVQGDVGSVKAALSAGAQAAGQVAQVHGVLMIPKPHPQVLSLLPGKAILAATIAHLSSSTPPSESELQAMNVHQLRSLARNLKNFELKGREISKAKRSHLLELITKHYN